MKFVPLGYLRREYTNADQGARWLAVVARRGSTLVGITMRAEASDFEGFHPIFDSVWRSLQFGE